MLVYKEKGSACVGENILLSHEPVTEKGIFTEFLPTSGENDKN